MILNSICFVLVLMLSLAYCVNCQSAPSSNTIGVASSSNSTATPRYETWPSTTSSVVKRSIGSYSTIYPLPSSPINTDSQVKGSLQCTKNSGESYAVCASYSNIAIKYNLQPFSFAAKGPKQDCCMYSCDLYETDSQSASRVVCVKGTVQSPFSDGVVFFHNVAEMNVVTNVTIGVTGNFPHVIVDTPNQIAYVSNYLAVIYKITNIGGSTAVVTEHLTSSGSGDYYPAAMLIVDGFLYVHVDMNPARLARINISSFKWNQTVTFGDQERYGYYDNLANDGNYIYDLTQGGILVRCTYKNNNFARFGSLSTGFSSTYSLTISPNRGTLFVVSEGKNLLQMVSTMSFAKVGNTVKVDQAFGRPIVTRGRILYAFSSANDSVYAFGLSNTAQTMATNSSKSISESRSPSIDSSASWTTTVTLPNPNIDSTSISHSSSISNSTTESVLYSARKSSFPTASITQSASRALSASRTTSDSNSSFSSSSITLNTSSSSSTSISSDQTRSLDSVSSSSTTTRSTQSVSISNVGTLSMAQGPDTNSPSQSSTKTESTSASLSPTDTQPLSVSESSSESSSPSATPSLSESATESSSQSHSPSKSSSLTASSIDESKTRNASSSTTPSLSESATKSPSQSHSLSKSPSPTVSSTAESKTRNASITESLSPSRERPQIFLPCVLAASQRFCHAAAPHCIWCANSSVCIDNRTMSSCDSVRCTYFTPLIAQTRCPNSTCTVCAGICVDRQLYSGSSCNPAEFDQQTCVDCHNCTWNQPVLLGSSRTTPYCVQSDLLGNSTSDLISGDRNVSAAAAACLSPPACSIINLAAFDTAAQCVASGCRYDASSGLCENHSCFNFFISSFVIQPFVLLLLGFLKDIVVLMLIGVAGDTIVKVIRRPLVPLWFWWFGWDEAQIKMNFDRTIYVNDEKARDHISSRKESFEQYCERVIDHVFELPGNINNNNNNNASTHQQFDFAVSTFPENAKKNNNPNQKENKILRQKVLDAVTFCFFDYCLWFDLDDDGYSRVYDAPVTLNAFLDTLGEGEEDEGDGQEELGSVRSFTSTNHENNRLRNNTSEDGDNKKSNHEKLSLTEEEINNRVKLQKIVTEAITKRATAVVFYASSRNATTRAAAALNTFPAPEQLVVYLIALLALMVSTCWSVLGDSANRETIQRISTYRCDDDSVTGDRSFATTEARTNYFLIGFRLMNASTMGTVILLLVKTVRAVWASNGTRFAEMNLPQRLPIMSLYTERASQVILFFYFGVTFPFAIAGFTFGLQFTGSIIVFVVALALLGVDVGALACLRAYSSRVEKEEQRKTKLAMAQEEKELNLLLGMGDDDNKSAKNNKNALDDPLLFGEESSDRNDNNNSREEQEDAEDWDEITAVEALDAKKNSLSNSAPTTLPKALLVFILTEELPTVLLTIALQMSYNYMCLNEYKNAFGISDSAVIPQREYDARRVECIWELFQNDVSGVITVLSSVFAFF